MGFFIDNFKYKVTFVGGEALLVEGHKGVLMYGLDEVVLRIKGGRLIIQGNTLVIEEINGEEVFIKGKISHIEVGA
ncbi:MAG: YabP/YqfC family sporulation protein [Clostridia bacterium]|nr:YabP/YqfC family sporulation protein [Clostridia bacterium]